MISRKRSGFTLVELLVVIAIIGILVSLLLPAIQAAREAGRRISCQNNIRQLGLASQNYHDTYKVFPPSGIVDTSSRFFDGRSGKMFSWLVLILPRIEQANLHDQFDFNVSILQQANNPQEQHLPTLRCPSDGYPREYYRHSQFTNDQKFAKGNYAAFCSPFHTELQVRFPGAFTSHAPNSDRHFQRDGTSNTMMLAEVRVYPYELDQRGAWALPWTGASLLAFDMHDKTSPVDMQRSGFQHHPGGIGANQPPNSQGPNLDMLYDCPDPAGAQLAKMPCNTFGGGANHYLSAAPRSNHPGGVNMVYVDGSVHMVPNTIDPVVMAYMVAVGDGQKTK